MFRSRWGVANLASSLFRKSGYQHQEVVIMETNTQYVKDLYYNGFVLCDQINASLKQAVQDPSKSYDLLIDIALTASRLEEVLGRKL